MDYSRQFLKRLLKYRLEQAEVAELVDAHALGACVFDVEVRVLSSAQVKIYKHNPIKQRFFPQKNPGLAWISLKSNSNPGEGNRRT